MRKPIDCELGCTGEISISFHQCIHTVNSHLVEWPRAQLSAGVEGGRERRVGSEGGREGTAERERSTAPELH